MKLKASLVNAMIAVFALTLSMIQLSRADEISDFYDNRQIRLLIGFTPGGGYDSYARLLARHLGKHIPGNPVVVPQNMPGAGSLVVANYLYNVAPKDGTVIGTFSRGIVMVPLLSGQGARFDATRFSWIGSLNQEVGVCVSWHTSAVKNAQDLTTKTLIVGGSGSGSDSDVFSNLVSYLLDANIKLISGYPGGSQIVLAMARGEVDGRCGWSWSSLRSLHPDLLAQNKINVLLQIALAKHSELSDVPLITEFADSDEELIAIELLAARQVLGRPFTAPPGIPIERQEALRRAFDATISDPDFQADAERLRLELNPVGGNEVATLINRLYDSPDNAVRLAAEAALGIHRVRVNADSRQDLQ